MSLVSFVSFCTVPVHRHVLICEHLATHQFNNAHYAHYNTTVVRHILGKHSSNRMHNCTQVLMKHEQRAHRAPRQHEEWEQVDYDADRQCHRQYILNGVGVIPGSTLVHET